MSFLHPELLPVYPGRALYTVYLPSFPGLSPPTDRLFYFYLFLNRRHSGSQIYPPSTGIPSNSQRDQPVLLHMCFGEEAAAARTGQSNISSDKTFFVCEAENLSKLRSQAAGMVPLWNYSLCPPTITAVFAKPTSAGLLLLKWSLAACGVQIPCQRCGQFGQSQMKVGPDLKCFDAL